MPKIPVSDVLGIEADGKLTPNFGLSSILPVVQNLAGLRLDQVPVDSVSLGFVFSQPAALTAGDVQLGVGAGARGAIRIIAAGKRNIDPDDPFDAVAAGADEMYLALRVSFRMQGGAATVHMGFDAEQEFTVTCYRRFPKTPAGFPLFAQALAFAAAGFILPRGSADLEELDPDTVVTLTGSGAVTISGSFMVAMPVQSLATASLSVVKLDVNAGASVTASAGLTLTGDYRVRLRRAGRGAVELGLYRAKGRELNVAVSAQAGVAAKVGSFDLAQRIIGAISSRPLADTEEFRQALPGENDDAKQQRIEAFEASLKSAVDTRVQASVSAALSKLQSDEAALLFEVTPAIAGAAITAALRGDWTLLAAQPAPAGVLPQQNVLTRSDVRTVTLKLNLFGILNLLSVGKMMQASRVERNGAGEITLVVDTTNATRLRATILNLPGIKRVQGLMNENFLMEAAYQASAAGLLPPDFTSRMSYLELGNKRKDRQDVLRALGIEKEDATYIEARYDNAAVRRMFLTGGVSRAIAEYETLGRRALAQVVAGDTGQPFRQRVANDDALWAKMKTIGNRALFPPLFGLAANALDPRAETAGGDYFAIVSWAKAMHAAAEAVAEADRSPTTARDLLKKRMAAVAASSDEHFGDPLGLLMVFEAADRHAELLTQ